jgi:predicted HTH transcriptional regulator
MLETLRRMLADAFAFQATPDDVAEGEQQVEAASAFESAIRADAFASGLDKGLLDRFNNSVAANAADSLFHSGSEALRARGLAVSAGTRDRFHPTAAAFVLFAPKPANRFPQCESLVDAYEGPRITGRPKGQAAINVPLPLALELALKFIDDQSFHPHRVVGLNTCDWTSIRPRHCAKRWSTRWRTATTRMLRARFSCLCSVTASRSPVPAIR